MISELIYKTWITYSYHGNNIHQHKSKQQDCVCVCEMVKVSVMFYVLISKMSCCGNQFRSVLGIKRIRCQLESTGNRSLFKEWFFIYSQFLVFMCVLDLNLFNRNRIFKRSSSRTSRKPLSIPDGLNRWGEGPGRVCRLTQVRGVIGCATYGGVQVALVVHGQVELGLNALYCHHTQTHRDEIKHGCGVPIKKCREFIHTVRDLDFRWPDHKSFHFKW